MNMRSRREIAHGRSVWPGSATRVPGVLMFGHYQYLAAQEGLDAHRHPGSLEICFLARGEQTYRVGRQVYRLRGGDQFITFADEWHDSAGEPQQKGELYWIIVQSVPSQETLLLHPSLSRPLLRGLARLPGRHFRAAPEAVNWLAQIEAALIERKSGPGQLALSGAIHQYLLGTLHAGSRALQHTPNQRVREAMDWMEARLGEPIRIREAAEAVGWSEAHFKAAFRRETGQTPHDYLLRRKMVQAGQLLAAGGQSVTDVAMALGFSSSQHFATAFRKFTGHTPSEARDLP